LGKAPLLPQFPNSASQCLSDLFHIEKNGHRLSSGQTRKDSSDCPGASPRPRNVLFCTTNSCYLYTYRYHSMILLVTYEPELPSPVDLGCQESCQPSSQPHFLREHRLPGMVLAAFPAGALRLRYRVSDSAPRCQARTIAGRPRSRESTGGNAGIVHCSIPGIVRRLIFAIYLYFLKPTINPQCFPPKIEGGFGLQWLNIVLLY